MSSWAVASYEPVSSGTVASALFGEVSLWARPATVPGAASASPNETAIARWPVNAASGTGGAPSVAVTPTLSASMAPPAPRRLGPDPGAYVTAGVAAVEGSGSWTSVTWRAGEDIASVADGAAPASECEPARSEVTSWRMAEAPLPVVTDHCAAATEPDVASEVSVTTVVVRLVVLAEAISGGMEAGVYATAREIAASGELPAVSEMPSGTPIVYDEPASGAPVTARRTSEAVSPAEAVTENSPVAGGTGTIVQPAGGMRTPSLNSRSMAELDSNPADTSSGGVPSVAVRVRASPAASCPVPPIPLPDASVSSVWPAAARAASVGRVYATSGVAPVPSPACASTITYAPDRSTVAAAVAPGSETEAACAAPTVQSDARAVPETGSVNVTSMRAVPAVRAAKSGGPEWAVTAAVVPATSALPAASARPRPAADGAYSMLMPSAASNEAYTSAPSATSGTRRAVPASRSSECPEATRVPASTAYAPEAARTEPGSDVKPTVPLNSQSAPCGAALPPGTETGSVNVSVCVRSTTAPVRSTVNAGGAASRASAPSMARPRPPTRRPAAGGAYPTVGVEAVESSASCVMSSDVCPADTASCGVTAAPDPAAGLAVAPSAGMPVSSSAAIDDMARASFSTPSPSSSSVTVQCDTSSVPEAGAESATSVCVGLRVESVNRPPVYSDATVMVGSRFATSSRRLLSMLGPSPVSACV